MAKKVQLMTNAKRWQVVNGVEVLVDVPQEDLDPITDSSCVEIEGHRTLEETINQENMFTPEIVETKVHSKVGGVYHDNVVDGAYKEAILYGNTQVNLVESMTSDTKYIPHSFTSFQGNESKIGNYNSGRTNQVAPLVKGVTMVNLVQEGSMTLEGGTALIVHNVKGNTEYTLKFTFTQKNNMAGIVIQSYKDKNGALTYLENSKLQSGLGDEVSITFTTHEQANRVHICNGREYGGETIQLDNIMVIEGDVTDLDLPFFKGMRSVELSRPLTNLFTDDLRWGNQGTIKYTNLGGNVTVTSNSIASWSGITFYLGTLKQNTKYLVMWDSLTQTQTSTSSLSIIAVYDVSSNTNIGTANSKTECPILRSIVFDTTGRDYTNIGLRVHATLSNSETGTTTVKGLRVFEWDDSLRTLDLQTIGYFSGTKHVSAPRTLETEGKNLYPYGDVSFTATNTNVDSWYDHKGTGYMHGDIALKSKSRFLLKRGTYTITTGVWVNVTACQLIDDKEQIIVKLDSGQRNHVFTLSQDTYCTLRIKASAVNTVTQIPNIQIEHGETGTTYEAYQSRYYKPRETEEIILRSLPNGVCDTFNLQTGELVQRIHSHVFDGATYELNFMNKPTEVSGDDVVGGWSDLYNMYAPKYDSFSVSCDILTRQRTSTCDSDYVNKEFFMIGVNTFIISLSKTRLNGLSISQYLTKNPITVQYELKEPIIKKLQTYNRIYSGQTNALVSMGNNLSALTYYANNYHFKVGNLSPVPAILEPITSLPYDVRLKPSTLYTIKYSRGGASNSMKFDLGGSVVEKTNSITDLVGIAEELTVRTPTILSHEQLQLSGTGFANNFIVVEGDITGTELPYFEGMKDAKMPIVKNIGKNLFDGELYIDMGINANGTTVNGCPLGMNNAPDWVTTKNLIPITKGKKISITIDADDEDITTNRRYVYVYKYDMNGNFIVNDRYDLGLHTKTYTMNHYGYIKCTIRTHNVKNITITETDTPQPCIDYRVNSVYAVQGEIPITSEMIEQGGFTTANGKNTTYETMKYEASIRLRSKELIPVKPNTTYAFAHSFSKFAYNVYQWNGNKEFIDGVSRYFASGQIETITTTADTQYIHFLMSKHDASQAITVAEYDWNNFHMYELDSTINLRSLPNGVKDELNLLTGEYIQRVGEVVLDGKNTQFIEALKEQKGDYLKFGMQLNPVAPYNHNVYLLNDRFNSETYSTSKEGQQEQIYIHAHSSTNTELRVCILPSKLSTPDEVGFNSYLQSNPITVQYELAEPIISHVRLVSNNQEREVGVKLPNGVCNTYNPSTGITTVRVGKVVLDGSENWKEDTAPTKPTDLVRFAVKISDMKGRPYNTGDFVYESNISYNIVNNDIISPRKLPNIWNYYENTIYMDFSPTAIGMTTSDTTETKLSKFKTYLASNPITVWYELKYPQIQPDIVLPNGVHDEYNPLTGLYTKRVGYVELDGSEDEKWAWGEVATGTNINTQLFLSPCPQAQTIPTKTECSIICDKLSFLYELWDTDQEGIHIFENATHIAIRVAKSKLTEVTTFGLKQYLSQNPLKVWYELQTPITYQLTPYFGLPQPYAYKDGYLIMDGAYPETTLPPEFKYKLVANRTGQVMQNSRKLQEHTTRLSNLEALIIEATIESLFNRELQLFELELMDIQLIDLGE